MPNPTRQEIIDAHTALENLSDLAFIGADSVNKEALANIWKDEIKRVVPPKPLPTMAEIEWDDDEHYLAEAEQEFLGKVIMLHLNPSDERIRYLQRKGEEARTHYAYPDTLTPTGRRYTLTEVHDD